MTMHDEHGRAKLFTRRALFLGAAQVGLFGALAGRMYYLQVVESQRYATLAEDNRINMRLIPPLRGRIVDRGGLPLAVNHANYRVVLVREQTGDISRTLDLLSQVIDISEHDRKRVLRDSGRRRAFVPLMLRENLTWEEVSQIEVNAPDLPGVSIEVGQTRYYPLGETLAHVLGYVAAVSEKELNGDPVLELPDFRIGKNGVEKQYDLKLRGTAGNRHVEVNAVGRVIRELNRDEGRPGKEAILSIDAGLQNFAHQRLMSERSASTAVIDIETGDVLAHASVPSYDPNAFSLGLSSQQWRAWTQDPLSPLTNKTAAGLYAPGSTFKMIVALAAMEAGVGEGHRVFCPGHMTLGNARFHCWKRGGHGWMHLHDAIEQSCDVYFYDVSRKAGIERIAAMARRLGLGQKVGIDLPGEAAGVIPDRDWKLANFDEPWQGGETLVTAIGQGFVLSTPLQLAVMTARLASGKAVVPRFLRGYRDDASAQAGPPPFADLDLPANHLAAVRRAMDAVVNDRRGTARRSRIEQEGWEMAGKTGTSQVRRITLAERAQGVTKNEDLPWHRRDHALFVAYAPVEKPRYAISVVVEHGGGGSKAAAPIARDIMLETLRRDPAALTPGQQLAEAASAEER